MTTEVASFSEYPGAWIIWVVNLACIFTTIFLGVSLAVKKKALFLVPLVAGIAATHGFRWFTASLYHDYPVPTVATFPDAVDAQGQAIPLISQSAHVDLIAWGAALTVILVFVANKKRANQTAQTTPGLRPSVSDL